ncbi:MAG: copper resistance protein CopC, partial [Pseudomonadota bacterium]
MQKTIHIILILMALSIFVANVTSLEAHSKIEQTYPQNQSILDQAPSHIDFKFSNPIKLIKVILHHDTNQQIDLEVDLYKDFRYDFSFPNPLQSKGLYRV